MTWALTLLMAAALSCAAAGCQEPETPEEALRGFVRAVYLNDGETAWGYLTREAQTSLGDRADAANAAGGAKIAPHTLLSGSGSLPPYKITAIIRGETQGERLAMTLKTADKDSHTVWMLQQDGQWRVDLGQALTAKAPQ